ncbi:thioredoxin family protein [Pontixanthobacter gangjinensis]
MCFAPAAFGQALSQTPIQNAPRTAPNLTANLVAEGAAKPGQQIMLAMTFVPVSEEWHGYWKNPGDAGYGMELDWELPEGWSAGEPLYPAPDRLLISGLMNHVFKGAYAVLIPVTVPVSARVGQTEKVGLSAQWLACTDRICVQEQGSFSLKIAVGSGPTDGRFAEWRGAIPPMIESAATFQITGENLRIAIPMPAGLDLGAPHLFLANRSLSQGLQPSYAARQKFAYEGDRLAVEIPLKRLILPEGYADEDSGAPEEVEGILSFGDGRSIQFKAVAGHVDASFINSEGDAPALGWLLLAALAGGLILNVMPCVFPILSLKAMSLVRAGGSERQARSEGLAYTAGVVMACVGLGGMMLALRAAGQQVGWAFQLQEPAVVVALLVLAAVITANLAGVFELPSLNAGPIAKGRRGKPASAFATGLLAAVVATPCTGPFMAAAMGAALLLPSAQALLLFAALGSGLALPFLLLGFIPRLRRMLPKPGPWMERFRRLMAIPMGLTALALIWLVSRLGGTKFALVTLVLVAGIIIGLLITGRLQRSGKIAWPAFGLIAAPFLIFAGFALPATHSQAGGSAAESILDPVNYSADALAEARAAGQPVFLWFTADWCVTCKVNEQTSIEREETRAAFEQAGVVAMRGDWTQPDDAITQYLTEQGVAGIPLYVWYLPGAEAEILPQILTSDIVTEPIRRKAATAGGNGQSIGLDAGLD